PFLQHGSQLAGGKPPGYPGTHLSSEEAYIGICQPYSALLSHQKLKIFVPFYIDKL
ncbi:hypothetical protein K443DRAFT_114060, partial [Laccaria amethystina LaAM-08-1]